MNGDLAIIPITAFKKPTKPELIAFWKIRHPSGSKIPGKGNKGKLEDAQNGENNLIKLAFESRNLPLLTPLTTPTTTAIFFFFSQMIGRRMQYLVSPPRVSCCVNSPPFVL